MHAPRFLKHSNVKNLITFLCHSVYSKSFTKMETQDKKVNGCTVDIIKWNSIKKSGMCFECAMHRVGVSIWVVGTTGVEYAALLH